MAFSVRQRTFRSSTATKIALNRQRLRLELAANHPLWSVQTRLEIPLARVAHALVDPVVAHDRPWSPMPAVSLPGLVVLGNASRHGDLVFWDVHDSDKAVVIELRDDWGTWLIVEVEDPPALVAAINSSVGWNDPDRDIRASSESRHDVTETGAMAGVAR